MNKCELHSVMVKHGDNQNELAKALGLSRPWLSAKINERKGAVFSQPEILAIKNRYHLSDIEIGEIFFTSLVS